jgi:hypothetical protein
MTIRGDKRKTAQQRTEARWSVMIDRDRDKGGYEVIGLGKEVRF